MNSRFDKKELPIIIGAFIAIYIIWGSTFMANKMVVMELPPFLLAGLRFCIASIIIFLIAFFTKSNFKANRSQLKNTFIAGLLFLTAGNGFSVWALQYVDSGFASVLIAAQPLVLLVMMRITDKKPIRLISLLGVSFGMIGIWLLVSQREFVQTKDQWYGIFALFLALLTWGYGSLFVSKYDLPKNQFINGAYQMLFGGVMMLVISALIQEDYNKFFTLSTQAKWALGYLIIFGSIIAFTSFNYLLVRISPEKVATSTYVNPIVALICGWYFLDEIITGQSLVATLILFTGVYFINSVRFENPSNKAFKRGNKF